MQAQESKTIPQGSFGGLKAPLKSRQLTTDQILALPEAPAGYEFLTNTTDKNWQSWCGRKGALMTKPKATEELTREENAKRGYFGLYAPRQSMSSAYNTMFAKMASTPQD